MERKNAVAMQNVMPTSHPSVLAVTSPAISLLSIETDSAS